MFIVLRCSASSWMILTPNAMWRQIDANFEFDLTISLCGREIDAFRFSSLVFFCNFFTIGLFNAYGWRSTLEWWHLLSVRYLLVADCTGVYVLVGFVLVLVVFLRRHLCRHTWYSLCCRHRYVRYSFCESWCCIRLGAEIYGPFKHEHEDQPLILFPTRVVYDLMWSEDLFTLLTYSFCTASTKATRRFLVYAFWLEYYRVYQVYLEYIMR